MPAPEERRLRVRQVDSLPSLTLQLLVQLFMPRAFMTQGQISNQSGGTSIIVYARKWHADDVQLAAIETGLPLVSAASYYIQKVKPWRLFAPFQFVHRKRDE